jgi:hypothetical protein
MNRSSSAEGGNPLGWTISGMTQRLDLPKTDVDRVSHLAKYYKKMDESGPWERG